SRRRHTRSYGDWSSDVCSSDLVRVHVKLDTGMGRLGTRDRADALEVAELVARSGPSLELAGAMTHFATADDDPEFLELQLHEFRSEERRVGKERRSRCGMGVLM